MTSRTLRANPKLDLWVRFETKGRVTVFTGKAELGQGLTTAIAMIAAEELDVALERVDVRTADTADGPNEWITAGSGSMEQSATALRQAAAEARRRLLELASRKLGVPIPDLEVADGTVRGGEAALTYWQLMEGRRFEGDVGERAEPKAAEQHRVVGRPAPRREMEELVTTGGRFVHDLERPGMVHGRIVRPPTYDAELQGVDDAGVREMSGVLEVVRDGRFLGVVALREEQAVAAGEALRAAARWTTRPLPCGEDDLVERLTANPRQSLPVIDGAARETDAPPLLPADPATTTLSARYFRPYHMHASIGPSAALAEQSGDTITVWCHSQGVALLKPSLAQVLDVEPDTIRVVHVPGAGCYGHNGADDAALDAVLLARAVPGRPVLLQWSRQDEHTWEPYGSAMLVDLRASLDAEGTIVDWSHDVYSDTHSGRPMPMGETSGLLAAWHRDPPMSRHPRRPSTGFHSGIHRNADPLYTFRRRRIVKHLVDDLPLRVSSQRGLGAFANVFAIESFMDELARAAGADPVEFRLRHLRDDRARDVIEAAVAKAGSTPDGAGRGLGFARYENCKAWAAVVADVAVGDDGVIRLLRFSIAADAGEVIDPDGLVNQLEGGALQSASWALKEQVRFDRNGIQSRDWESYPILTFPEIPEVGTVLLDRPGAPFLGAGEATQGPTPAAIANAVFAACGARLRHIPFTPERVRASRPA
ncbi:MAG: xanthine dehydrogenase family protein molybdopterin-binding subunit [Deltaproteobacteria bacterium]|nr:xanthine dehydrogenase family protein molybdopterin-binding subunit [Deltaproteobacteria bacterium]MBW2415337.1 xanthine dehydrogenase family protein molybdopterin-binding subunit [Deltaproteobacteria bacterium]